MVRARDDRSGMPGVQPMSKDAFARYGGDYPQALLDAIYEAAPVGLGFWDRELRFVRLNRRLAEMNGLPVEAHIGRTPIELLPGIAGLDPLMHQWRAILGGELPSLTSELTGETPAQPGAQRYWLEHFFPVRAEGRIIGVGGIVEEITGRKLAEVRLRESEERFRWIVQRAPIPIFVHALDDGEMLVLSQAVTEQTGWTLADIPDVRSWYIKGRRVEADALDARLDEVQRKYGTGEPLEPEAVIWTKSGEQRHWWINRSEVQRLASGRPFIASMAIDVTEREAAQAALREADRRKDEFLAMLAHELRNPLAPIRNAVELMKTRGTQSATGDGVLLEIVERQVSHLVRLVDDLLDVSRVTRGKIALRKSVVDLGDAIRSAVEMVRPGVQDKRQVLDVALPDQPVWIDADATRLVQVVFNLLSNAMKFSEPERRIELVLATGDDRAVIRVEDEGRGIPRDLLPTVFDLFTQGDHTLDRNEGGLGIGLSLVRALVGMHGGSVEAASAGTGSGSVFTVSLPLAPSPAAACPGSSQVPERRTARRRILVVDDNKDSAESLQMLLELWGHQARCAYDGAQALDTARSFRPEVILLDIGLPGMNGYEVARRLRAQPGMQDLMLIAVTGYGQEDDKQSTRAAGFDHHLVKPIDPDALERLLGT